MADDDHSLLLLDFLDTSEIRSKRVMWERVTSWMRRSFMSVFDFQSAQHCTFCLRSHSQQTTAADTKHERLAYHVLYVLNT